jgi:Transposase DDE domain
MSRELVTRFLPFEVTRSPGLTCGISVPASTLQRACQPVAGCASIPLISGLPMPSNLVASPFRSWTDWGTRTMPDPKAGDPSPGHEQSNGGLRRDESDGREALGRSRGGLTTKIHLAADRRCRPIARLTSPGQRFDGTMLLPVLGQVRIKRCGIGRDRVRPGRVLADKAYSSRAIRAHLRRRGIKAVIPEKTDQQKWRKHRGAQAAARSRWIPMPTRTATSSNAASASSSSSGRSQPATAKEPSSTTAPSTSPPSRSGSATSPKIRRTRPRSIRFLHLLLRLPQRLCACGRAVLPHGRGRSVPVRPDFVSP